MTGDELLTPTEMRLLAAIKANPGATSADLAAEIGNSERHVRRLLARERVRKALDAAARAGLASASSVLGRNAQRAAEALAGMAAGTSKATTPRVQACRAVLDGAGRLIDLVALEDRIKRLEMEREPSGGLQ
ncbi:MAG TPA: winged helix-turn-helix transcriptional regulator [Polyangia bacterium]|nr:winged helix-turn-helix transcriptional regulator [Polyangia bacterium]